MVLETGGMKNWMREKAVEQILNYHYEEKAIEDLNKGSWLDGKAEGIEEGIEKGKAEGIVEGVEMTIFSLRREGYLKKEDAASKLRLSVEEYCRREDRFFS